MNNNIRIEELNDYVEDYIDDIVNIHLKSFKNFFLTFMGRGFLKCMYTSYILHKDSGIYIAFKDDVIIGFLAYSNNLSELYKYMIQTRLHKFAWYSIGAFLRKPKIFMRLIRAFIKPSESNRNEKYVELASIGVNPESKAKGAGTLLVRHLIDNVDFNKFEYIKLETDADDNDYVNLFYQKNGFVLNCEYKTPEGRNMNEYRYAMRWC